jgi:hypothetical protein
MIICGFFFNLKLTESQHYLSKMKCVLNMVSVALLLQFECEVSVCNMVSMALWLQFECEVSVCNMVSVALAV